MYFKNWKTWLIDWLIDFAVMCRYIDSQNGKVMQDIISSKLYKEQFDAIQDCFRIIGFTDEVWKIMWPLEALWRLIIGFLPLLCSVIKINKLYAIKVSHFV